MVFNNPRCPGPIPITLEAATPVHASLLGRQGGADSMTTSTAGPPCDFRSGEPWGQFSDLFEILEVATKWSSRPVPREVLSSLEGKAMVFNNPRCPGPIPITLEAATQFMRRYLEDKGARIR